MDRDVLHVGICDDNKHDMDQIEAALYESIKKLHFSVEMLCRKFTDGERVYEESQKNSFQLLFLDIEMPVLNGFELAEKLQMNQKQTYLVFVSAYESFVFDASEYTPLWFVRKSKLEWDMFRAVRKYIQMTASLRVNYRLKDGFSFRDLPIKDILFIECSGHNLVIYRTDGSKLEKYGSLKAMEEELEGYHFIRIHKNFLVNQRYIKEVGKREVYLTDQRTLEMGRDRRVAVREAMLLYEKERHGGQ